MRRVCVALFGVLMFTVALRSASMGQEALAPRANLEMSVDYARFNGNEDQLFLEVYYAFREDALTYRAESTQVVGACAMSLELWSDSAREFRRQWVVPHILIDSQPRAQYLMGLQALGVAQGKYRLIFDAYDLLDTLRRDSLTLPLNISPPQRSAMGLSDLELCSLIKDGNPDSASIFYKNTKEVTPNPSLLYGIGMPILYYYLEVYNLVSDPRPASLMLKASVLTSTGQEISTKTKKKPRTYDSTIEIGTMNLSAVPGGTYTLQVQLVDSLNAVYAQSSKKFFVFNPKIQSKDSSLAGTKTPLGEFSMMSGEDIDLEIRYLRYVSSDRDKGQLSQLSDVEAKRQYLASFWKSRDLVPETPQNEYRDEYLKRVVVANTRFTIGTHVGWETDRGRVLIMYGEPDEIERTPSGTDTYPYEIWHYDRLQGGVIFVFVDLLGMNDHQLVHSTLRGELRNDNWYEEFASRPFRH